MLEAISNYIIVPQWALLPTFEVVQQFKRLPDFLMFPIFLALTPQDYVTSASPEAHDREIIRAMNTFISFAREAQKRSQLSSDAVKYAHQNWVVHLSRAPNPWDNTLNHIFPGRPSLKVVMGTSRGGTKLRMRYYGQNA
jgi:hypothetical protein